MIKLTWGDLRRLARNIDDETPVLIQARRDGAAVPRFDLEVTDIASHWSNHDGSELMILARVWPAGELPQTPEIRFVSAG